MIAGAVSEIGDWIIISGFARTDNTAMSVGLNAVRVLKARKR